MVVVGATGSGKTNLMMRLWAGWFTAAANAAAAGRGRAPLLIVLDCKGGGDARVKAGRTWRLLHGAGARRVAIWPDEARPSLWDLPPADLAVLLFQMIESGDGAAAYYADIMQAVLTLAVTAPCGPPARAADFLARLDGRWVASAWDDGLHLGEVQRIRGAARHLPDIQLRFATLLGRLGQALDGPGNLRDADAWYFILEGTSQKSVAEAQAMAITELAAHAATDPAAQPRAILLAADDYSSVSGRVPLSNLYERGRSLGIGVQVSAQTWQGLGATEDERYRIAATADGGVWVMKHPVSRAADRAGRDSGGYWRPHAGWSARPGATRAPRASTGLDRGSRLIRRLDVGQACYIHRGAATFVQVARPKPSPLTLAAGLAWLGRNVRGWPARGPAARAPARSQPRGRVGHGPPRPRHRARRRPVSTDPFAALGLPVRNDLTNEQVRAAWRHIAAATHPDRPDGGDIGRYTAAASAYAQLRTDWGRSEADADGGRGHLRGRRGENRAAARYSRRRCRGCRCLLAEALARPGWPVAGGLLPAHIARGDRPLRLALRGIAARLACLPWSCGSSAASPRDWLSSPGSSPGSCSPGAATSRPRRDGKNGNRIPC